MKRSEINTAIRRAREAFAKAGWALPPDPKWDVTDLGLGRFPECGLVLINLAEEAEYCEKLIYSLPQQLTPLHAHQQKKEDIICRWGQLAFELWEKHPDQCRKGDPFRLKRNGAWVEAKNGEHVEIAAGERVTLTPGLYHAFWAANPGGCVIGEVSTANDDANDNFFVDPEIGRFPDIEEDEPPLCPLLSDRKE